MRQSPLCFLPDGTVSGSKGRGLRRDTSVTAWNYWKLLKLLSDQPLFSVREPGAFGWQAEGLLVSHWFLLPPLNASSLATPSQSANQPIITTISLHHAHLFNTAVMKRSYPPHLLDRLFLLPSSPVADATCSCSGLLFSSYWSNVPMSMPAYHPFVCKKIFWEFLKADSNFSLRTEDFVVGVIEVRLLFPSPIPRTS